MKRRKIVRVLRSRFHAIESGWNTIQIPALALCKQWMVCHFYFLLHFVVDSQKQKEEQQAKNMQTQYAYDS